MDMLKILDSKLNCFTFSENDADIPSSSTIDMDYRKIKSEEKTKVCRQPLKEVVKKARRSSARLSPSDTCSSGSDKEDNV